MNTLLDSSPSISIPESPLYDLCARGRWVLVRMLSKEERKTAGGIILSQAQAKTQHGVIVDVDTSVVKDLVPGQIVIFTNFTNELEDIEELTGRRDLHLIRDEEVYAVAKEIKDPERLAELRREANVRRDQLMAEANEAYEASKTQQ